MKITEENFIKQLKKGNEKALDYVIDNYAWILKTVIKKHLFKLPDYYEECMNDCLMGIWENICAKYKSLNYVRKYLKDLENENIENIILPEEDNALKEILENEISTETEKMLKSISEEDRGIFIKLYLEDKNMDEISFDTGLAKPVIYNRLSRGKKKIREAFSIKGGSGNEGF